MIERCLWTCLYLLASILAAASTTYVIVLAIPTVR